MLQSSHLDAQSFCAMQNIFFFSATKMGFYNFNEKKKAKARLAYLAIKRNPHSDVAIDTKNHLGKTSVAGMYGSERFAYYLVSVNSLSFDVKIWVVKESSLP